MTDEGEELDPRWEGVVIPREHWHFCSQLLLRYGIVLAPGEFSWIVAAIENGTALLIEQRRGKQAIYSMRIPRVRDRIYVLAVGRRIITAWPPESRLNRMQRCLPRSEQAAKTST